MGQKSMDKVIIRLVSELFDGTFMSHAELDNSTFGFDITSTVETGTDKTVPNADPLQPTKAFTDPFPINADNPSTTGDPDISQHTEEEVWRLDAWAASVE